MCIYRWFRHLLRKFLLLIILLILWAIFFFSRTTGAEAPGISCDTYDEMCLKEWTNHYAELYGIDKEKIFKTIQGESEWIVDARGDGGKAYGVAQYWLNTFLRHSKACGFGFEEVDYYDPLAQLSTMTCAFSKGWAKEWTVYRRLYLQ